MRSQDLHHLLLRSPEQAHTSVRKTLHSQNVSEQRSRSGKPSDEEGRLTAREMSVLAGDAWLHVTRPGTGIDTSLPPDAKAGSAHKMTLGIQERKQSPVDPRGLVAFKSQRALRAINGRF